MMRRKQKHNFVLSKLEEVNNILPILLEIIVAMSIVGLLDIGIVSNIFYFISFVILFSFAVAVSTIVNYYKFNVKKIDKIGSRVVNIFKGVLNYLLINFSYYFIALYVHFLLRALKLQGKIVDMTSIPNSLAIGYLVVVVAYLLSVVRPFGGERWEV